jgi:electron transfer flavoprotein alpha subunit
METLKKHRDKGNIIKHKVLLRQNEIGIKTLDIVKEKKKSVNISEAKVIIAGGRGVGNAGGFAVLKKLSSLMGGEIAGTRVAVEEGWIPAEQQVGQTGQSVRPELYVACGISGAIQHRAGMINSRYIIAINKDPRAPIFQVADWCIVGDLKKIVPEMIRQLEKA